jgi:purine-binding chemotaxis protein CheW
MTQSAQSPPKSRPEDTSDGSFVQEFLTFALGSEEYAIDILTVQEIRGYEQPTHLANLPAFIKGVINLRGSIVPIVDLRIKFGIDDPQYSPFTVVIILIICGRTVGIVVDGVSDVTTLQSDQIRPRPEFSVKLNTTHIEGLGILGNRLLIIIDVESLLLAPEMGLANSPADNPDRAQLLKEAALP